MEDKFKPLEDKSEDRDAVIFLDRFSVFKINDLMQAIKSAFQYAGFPHLVSELKAKGGIPTPDSNTWFKQGVDCEVMKPNAKGWKKGKVRIKILLEFCPDEPEVEEIAQSNGMVEPESPLDDLRQRVN